MRLILFYLLIIAGTPAFAQMPRHRDHQSEGWKWETSVDYDSSRFRTSAFSYGIEAEWGTPKFWASLSLDTYTDFKSHWDVKYDLYSTLSLGAPIHRDKKKRFFINVSLDVDGPSLLAERGLDLTPEINLAKGLTKDWWVGGALSAVLSTAPDEGNRAGYGSLTLWVTWLCKWLPNESDSIGLSMWAATNEVPGSDNALFFGLDYDFDISAQLGLNLGIGTDVSSPWERQGVYATALITWRF